MSEVGVVTIAHGRHEHLLAQHRSLACSTRAPDRYVVVAMGDEQIEPLARETSCRTGLRAEVLPIDVDPLGLPLAAARNWGADLLIALGCDVLVGLDVDCLAGPGLVAGYAADVGARPDLLWSGPVTYLDPPPPAGYRLESLGALDDPHPARPAPSPGHAEIGGDPNLFWSLSFALSARVWTDVGGFDEGYVGYGAEDTDFGHRARAAGVAMAWSGSARAYHQHHPVSDPPVEHVDDILRNGRRYRARWGAWPMQGWLDGLERAGLVERRGDDYVRS